MAVTATFAADFSSFQAAVEKAEVKLRSFASGAVGVEKALTRMADSFSGRKVLQEAELATKAVEGIGGASKLTEAEQRRLNATLTEALAKYKALGMDAPKAMTDLEKATRAHTSVLGDLQAKISAVGPAILAAFSVTAVIAATKKVIDYADQITNLSAKTGIGTDGLQKLELAFQGAGVTLDTVTTHVTKLAKTLLDGDKGPVSAMGKLGLSVDALKKMAPEQQFLAVADAVGKIQDPTEKAYAAMTIFGKGGSELLAGLTGDLTKTTDEFARMGLIIDEQTLKAADDFGDQLGVLTKMGTAFLATALAPLLPGLVTMAQFLIQAAGATITFAKALGDHLILGLMQASVWFNKFVLAINVGASKIPFFGKAMGATQERIAGLRLDLQYAEDRLGSFRSSMARVEVATTTARPALLGLGKVGTEAGEALARAAEKAREAWEKFTTAVDEQSFGLRRLALDLGNVAPAIENMNVSQREFVLISEHGADALAAHTAAAKADIAEMSRLGMLMPAIGAEADNVTGAFEKQAGVFALLGDSIKTNLSASLKDLPKTIMAALTGGGDVGKAVGGSIFGSIFAEGGSLVTGLTSKLSGALGKTVGGALGSILPGIGTMLGSYAGEMIGPLLAKVWDGIKGLGSAIAGMFGGPDAKEKEGRSVAAAFRDSLDAMLTDVQKLEAGNERWKQSVIVVRDAYIAAGKSEADALDIMDRLWRAEKLGGDAVRRVMEEITGVTRDHLMPALTGALGLAEHGFRAATDAGLVMRDTLGQPIVIPIIFDQQPMGAYGKPGSEGGGGGYLTPDEANAAGVAWRPKSDYNWSDSAYANVAYEDELEQRRQAVGMHRGGLVVPQYLGWGGMARGTDTVPAMLTPGEGVLSRRGMAALDKLNAGGGDDREMAAAFAGLDARLGSIEALLARGLREQPRAVGVAVRDALVLTR